MGFKCGIVGLPNVGKSTLFNALTATMAAESANFPFCTIEPNVGLVAVPDHRLDALAQLAGSQKVIPTQIEFVDIAGLVAGASKGEGLGNKFLAHIREVDAVAYVLRCFEDEDVTHVEGTVDPLRDVEIIETELLLADLESLEGRIPNMEKKARGNRELTEELVIVKELVAHLAKGGAARELVTPQNRKAIANLNLLSSKPVMYICNVEEEAASTGNALSAKVATSLGHNKHVVVVSAKIEQDIANLDSAEEKKEFLDSLSLKETGLSKIIKTGYMILDLITYFTVGPKEARAWTVEKATKAPQAAGVIHTDFEKGFIRAETISYEDYVAYGTEAKVKEAGKMRLEGKDYIVQDGDVMHFRFAN